MTVDVAGARQGAVGSALRRAAPEPGPPDGGPGLAVLSTPELADLVAEHTMAVRRAEAAVLTLACEWADRHPVLHPAARLSTGQRSAAVRYGGEVLGVDAEVDDSGDGPVGTGGTGTPEVSVFAIAELAVLRRTSIGSGHSLLADALDLRHRLREVNARTMVGAIPLSLARRTARETRHLTREQAAGVDAWMAEVGPGLSWSRYVTVLAAAVIDADPARAAERARAAALAQDVCSRGEPDGLASVLARIDAGDAAILMAMVHRLADILHIRTGDTWTAGQRWAKALGLLGRPLQALALLAAHHRPGDTTDTTQSTDITDITDTVVAPDPMPDGSPAADPSPPRPPRSQPGWSGEPSAARPQGAVSGSAPRRHADDPDGRSARSRPPERAGDREESGDHERPGPAEPPRHTLAGQDPPEEPEPLGDTVLEQGRPPDPRSTGEPGRLERDLAELRAATGTDADRWVLDAWDAGAPRAELVFHLADHLGLVRPEHPGGPLTVDQLVEGLSLTGAHVTVRPVIDPGAEAAVDGYELTPRLRRALRTREPASVFPWSAGTSPRMDADHTVPYRWDESRAGPAEPGQTGLHNSGPLGRREHRVRTHGGFAVRQPVPGHYLWRTPSGHHYLVTHHGTTALGRGPASRQLWDAARHQRPDDDP